MKRIFITTILAVSMVLLVTCEKKKYEPNEIELVSVNKLYFVNLEINKVKGRFLLDTGANSSYINYDDIGKFKLFVSNRDTGINLTGIGGTGGQVYELHSFKLTRQGEDLPSNVSFKTTDLKGIKLRVNGIIGGDYLARNKAVIDYSRGVLILNKGE